MASGRRQSEGIALLSIYGDEDEEMEDMEENQPDDIINDVRDAADNTEDVSDTVNDDKRCDSDRVIGSDSGNDGTPLQDVFNENFTPKSINFGTSTPQQQPQISLSSPPQQLGALETNRTGRGTLGIVDYGHDEVAMSPEAEEGEVTTGRVMVGEELQNAYGEFHEKTPPGTVQVLTPSTQATPLLPSEQHDMSQSDAMNYTENDLESNRVEEADLSAEEPKDIDLLDKFLPPPPKAKCPDELQEKIIKFLSFKKTTGRSFNSEVRNRKEYRNPDFLLHAVTYQDIDQIGSCFSKDVFDPHGYDKSDYYDELEADMKREMERKEQERKKSPKVDFISGAAQPGTIVPSPKLNLPIQVASGGLLPVPTSVDAVARDSRQNKKSKWDKVDGGDRRHPLPPGGKDSASAAGAHAALLSAANAGTGYTAFAQQRRREAEERKSSDKKSERRT